MPQIDSKENAEEPVFVLALMSAMMEATTDGILVTDAQGRITNVNTKLAEMWSLSWDKIDQRDIQKFQTSVAQKLKSTAGYLARIAEIEASQGPSFDLLELADGKSVERHSTVFSIREKVLGRVWNFRDVTQRQESDFISHRLASIVDNSEDAIVGKDLNSIVTSWNKAAERIFGYSTEEMVGTSVMRLIPPELQNEEEEILSRIRRGERYNHFDTIRLTKDGRQLHVSLSISPIKDARGNIVGASKIARDITDRSWQRRL
jgi:PAS domain S-box-containing protein